MGGLFTRRELVGLFSRNVMTPASRGIGVLSGLVESHKLLLFSISCLPFILLIVISPCSCQVSLPWDCFFLSTPVSCCVLSCVFIPHSPSMSLSDCLYPCDKRCQHSSSSQLILRTTHFDCLCAAFQSKFFCTFA